MSGKRYNKEVKKQLTMSLISDELGQASTKKKEFLGIMEKLMNQINSVCVYSASSTKIDPVYFTAAETLGRSEEHTSELQSR